MAVNPQKFLPSAKSSSVKISKNLIKGSSQVAISEKSLENIGIIRIKVIEIDKILKGTLAAEKKNLIDKKKEESTKRREKTEEKLETNPRAEKASIKMPQLPRMGFLDWVKNFIGNIILGYFAVRMVDYLPKIIPIIKFIGQATDFVLDLGGKLLDGLVTFVDWGYKAYDATRGFVKNLFGNAEAKQFDQLSSALNKFLNLVIIAGMVTAGSGGFGGRGGGGTKPGVGGKPRVTTSGGGRAGRIDVRNPLRQRPDVTTGVGGKPQLRLPGTAARVTTSAAAKKGLLSSVRPFLKRVPLPVVGALIDFGLSWALGENPGRAAFRAIGAGILGTIGGGLAGALGLAGGPLAVATAALGAIAGGSLGDMAGGALYDLFFGGKKAKSPTKKMAGGGITRGGKTPGGVRRSLGGRKGKTKKYKRTIAPRKPGEVKTTSPGSDVGGEEKLFGIFPNPFKKVVDKYNPFKNVASAGKNLGESDYFGPIFAIASKIILGQKPSQSDYQNVGLGINMLVAKGINDGKLKGGLAAAFAEGGFVDPKTLDAISQGGDISDWVAKSFKDATDSNAQKTLREIQDNLRLKGADTPNAPTGQEEQDQEPGSLGSSGAPSAPGNAHPGWARIYELARKAGDPFPEVTASQWAIESGYGKYKTGKNNPFGQTGTHPKYGGTTLATPRDPGGGSKTFMNFGSESEAVAFRVKRWVPEYGNAKTPYEALMNIQKHGGRGRYAQGWPTRAFPEGDWMGYVRSVSGIIKSNGGNPNRPRVSGVAPSLDSMDGKAGSLPGGVTSRRMLTGPSQYIGWSTDYHIDTKFHRSLGMGNMVSAMDRLANAYSSRGRKIEFSNEGVAGSVWNPNASSKEKRSLLQRAIDAHSHSTFMRREGFLPFDYFIPKKNDPRGRYGKSAEGAEILLPSFGGKIDVGTKYGGYGKSAEIYSGNKMVALTGHGDTRYEKGGFTKNGPHMAMIGEKGREFVIDADSTAAIEQTFPGFLSAINEAKYKDAINVLRNFASYESEAPQTIFVPLPEMAEQGMVDSEYSGGSMFISGGEESDPFSSLYIGG